MKRLTQEDFVNKANSVHNNLYDYSLSEYKTSHTKVKILCKIHGVFEQSPCNHFSGRGCPECGASSGITTEDFIKRAREVHGDKFDYSKTEYVKAQEYITIGCKVHGYFEQTPSEHLAGKGCYKCSGKMLKTTEQFIKESKIIHGNFYDYSLVDYKGQSELVNIICPVHGEFKQKPFNHLQGRGCKLCGREKSIKSSQITKEDFKKSIEKYNFNVDFESFVDMNTNIKCICDLHGEFFRTPTQLKNKSYCQKCVNLKRSERRSLSNDDFIKRCKKIYGDTLDFSKTKYKSIYEKVCFSCKNHGEREALPSSLLYDKSGCTLCSNYGGYSKDREGILYVNYCLSEKDYIKYGITNNIKARVKGCLSKNKLVDLINLHTFIGDGYSIAGAEKEIKTYFGNFMSKYDTPDGYSETINPKDYLNLITLINKLILKYNIKEI